MLTNCFNMLVKCACCGVLVSALATLPGIAAAQAQDYKLAPGDQLLIALLEREQINGVYRIEGDGTVSVPGIGVLTAAGLDLRSFEAALLQSAAETIVDPSVSVQIAQYRPIFVLGDVDKPGVYAYMPNLNAMQAVAVAGGFGRRIDTDALSRSVAINQARKSLSDAQADQADARINLARLRAEKAMTDRIEFDAADASSPHLAEARASAQALFEARQQGFSIQLARLQATLEARQREIAAFDSQLQLQEEVMISSRAQLEEARKNRERGLVPDSRIEAIERDEQNTRAQQLQIVTMKRQAETSLAQVEREIASLVSNRDIDIDQTIQAYQTALKRATARIREDRALLAEAGATQSTPSGEEPAFRLELRRGAALIGDDIDLGTSIAPGDTLFVVLVREGEGIGH